MPEDVLRRLIKLCVCDNTFVFNNKVYQQIDGVAMGSSLEPVLTNIWMAHLEEKFILTSALSPQFYRRYVDDTFCLFKKQADVHLFHDYLNSIDVSTQFDVETESDGQLAFLDTIVSHNDNNHYPDTSTRVKPTDKRLFYNFNSFIPISYKRNLISCMIYRVYHIASSFKIFDIDLFSLENKFIRNGSPLSLIDDATGKFLNNQYSIKDKALTVPKRPVIIILPFLGPISYYVRIYIHIYVLYASSSHSVPIFLSVCFSLNLCSPFSLFLSFILSLPISLSLSLSVSLCLSLSLFLSLPLPLSLTLYLFLYVSVSLCLSVYLSLCFYLSLSISLCICLSVCISLSL